jgi:hypothetical protein
VSTRILDVAGTATSLACAIHCAVAPLLIGTLAARLANENWEWVIIVISLCLGVGSLLPAYRKQHGKRRCLSLFSLGICSILAGRLLFASDTVFVVSGAALIVFAHLSNHYFCAQFKRCQ